MALACDAGARRHSCTRRTFAVGRAVAAATAGRDDRAVLEPHDMIDHRGQIVFDVCRADEREIDGDARNQRVELDACGASRPLAGSSSNRTRGLERNAARDQYAPLLAARQLEEAPLGEMRDAEVAHHCERPATFRGVGPPARYVGSIGARKHNVERGEVPAPTSVAVLELVAHDRDLAAGLNRIAQLAAAEVVAPLAASGAGQTVPPMSPRKVDLPLPFAPTMPQCSPRASRQSRHAAR